MQQASVRIAAILSAALMLTGCGMTSSPADNVTFVAPKGWHGSPGIMGLMQFWTSPGGDQQLVLVKSPKKISDTDVFTSTDLKNAQVEVTKAIVICGNQPAVLLKARGTTKAGRDGNAEVVKSDAGGATYVAAYVYPLGAQPNAAAESAVRELCLKS
jgi:hypothetical protein